LTAHCTGQIGGLGAIGIGALSSPDLSSGVSYIRTAVGSGSLLMMLARLAG
jgi:hypothetical protein